MGEKFWFACSVCKSYNYVRERNKAAQRDKLKLKKFCRACGKHTEHVESRLRD